MRSWLYSLVSLATFASALSAAPTGKTADTDAVDAVDDVVPDTTFNGQTVPPMKELNMDIAKDISKGNWLVEFFSPACPHCQHFKPTWQTLYEFYYTSKPIMTKEDSDGDNLNSFTRYYDFKFAKTDCMAFRDACEQYKIDSYPQVVHFKDGVEVKKLKGAKDIAVVSKWIEETLESIRPGSRVQGGPKLPKVGADSVETGPETAKEAQDKSKEEAAEKAKVAPSSTVKSEPTKASKPKPTYNPSGVSEPLTAEKFQSQVTNTLDPWFIKFYAPWCGHCQAMQPNWEAMAKQMGGKLNVGEVNCDVEKMLCKNAKVKGYPTLLFFRGGERTEYNGLRGVGDLIAYAEDAVAVGTGVPDVDLAAFEELEKTEEVIFVFFYDIATTSEDFQALEQLTMSLIGKAKLVKTNDPNMSKRFKISTWPRFMVSRDGKPSYYTALAPKDTRDNSKVLAWMKSVWLPIVPELTSSNAKEIMDGKFVVLGILSRARSDDFIIAKREIKNAALEWIDKQTQMYQLERQELRDAKQLRIEEAEDKGDERALRNAKATRINMNEIERKQVGFAWVDGEFWDRWVRTTYGIHVEDGDRVVINDEDNKRYWDTTISGEPIRPSRTAILETISKVVASPPKIASKSTAGALMRWVYFVRNFCTGHPVLAIFAAIGLSLAGISFSRSRRRQRVFGNTGGFFHVGEKDGLLGGSPGGGKKD